MHSVSDEHTVNISRDSNLMALIGGLKDRILESTTTIPPLQDS
jgi:hypothetical protein